MRFCVSGGAPLSETIARFFHGLGVLILEGYGLTETSPVITCNRLDRYRFGTVGVPVACAEVRIADDGEVLTKGPCVMKGYYRREEETRAAIENGWFHTGDLGRVDADGFLTITGRKKEIIVTSGGKKICPQTVEALFENHPLVLRCLLYGEGKNFLTALIVPNVAELKKLPGAPVFDDDRGLVRSDWARAQIQQAANDTHAHLAPYEQVKYFALLERDFSVEAGELTPTLKPRRSLIFSKYGALLEKFYGAA